MIRDFARLNICAPLFGTYPSFLIASLTRFRVSSATLSAPLVTRDTVCVETPANRATSLNVTATAFSYSDLLFTLPNSFEYSREQCRKKHEKMFPKTADLAHKTVF